MPYKSARPCTQGGCASLTNDATGYCPIHKKIYQKQNDSNRPTSNKRGYDYRWHNARTSYLQKHPLCVYCLAEGKIACASVIDHIIPHRGDYKLMWDESNWQALCTYHHNVKTAKEDGAFGNRELRAGVGG